MGFAQLQLTGGRLVVYLRWLYAEIVLADIDYCRVHAFSDRLLANIDLHFFFRHEKVDHSIVRTPRNCAVYRHGGQRVNYDRNATY